MKPLLIVQVGDPVPVVEKSKGPFHVWITAKMGLDAADVEVIDVRTGAGLPDPTDHSGIVITGSSSYVTDREHWSERTAAWLPSVVESRVPFLGICYGHHLLAHGCGGRTDKNPRGREIGTIEVTLTEHALADPLFGALPSPLVMQATHVESVLEMPPSSVLLCYNDLDAHQGFRLGDRAWSIQFHPEFDVDVVRGYIEARRDLVAADGLDVDAILACTVDSDHGVKLLRRFAELI